MSSITVDRILELAEKHGVSLEVLNDLIGAYRGKTGAWKSGRVVPTFSELNTLANYFNVSLDYLLGQSNIAEPPSSKVSVSSVTPPAQAKESAGTGGSYLYVADGGGGRKITIPPDKVFRVLKLIEAAFPELLNK